MKEGTHQAEAYAIDRFDQIPKDDLINIIKKSTYIGLAHPIYGASVPPIMIKFIFFIMDIISSEKISVKPLYIINTFGYINAFGPIAAQKLLRKDCFNLRAYINIRLCNNISTISCKTAPITDKKLCIRKQNAIGELRSFIKDILSSKKHIKGIGLYLLPGIIIRKKSSKGIVNHYKELSVQTSTCNRCMLCVRKCPANCISFINEQFTFSNKFTACMRCYNFCPTASILINSVFTDPQEYVRYRGPCGGV